MKPPIVLKMPMGDLVLIYSDGRVLIVEPDGEILDATARSVGQALS